MSIISETGFIFCNTPFWEMSSFFLHIQGAKERDAQLRLRAIKADLQMVDGAIKNLIFIKNREENTCFVH